MTLLKRGSAAFLAFLLVVHLALFPLRACAMSSALVAVGGATVIAATLAACGIYLYASAGEGSFGEWGARALTDLLEKYNQAHVESAIRMEQVRAYVVGRTLAIGRGAWDKLRDFAAWVRDTYALTDNQMEVGLGEYVGGYPCVPVISRTKDFKDSAMLLARQANGDSGYFVAASDEVLVCFCNAWGHGLYVMTPVSRSPNVTFYYYPADYSNTSSSGSLTSFTSSYLSSVKLDESILLDGVYYYYVSALDGTRSTLFADGIISVGTNLNDVEARIRAMYGIPKTLAGVTADTTTVSVPAALPAEDDSEFVGLSVYPGTVSGIVDTPATVMTPEKVEQIIQQGVMSRERPVVTPVEVEVAAGTDVDAETGVVAVTDSGVTIDAQELEEQYVPAVSELAVPQAFLDSLAATMRTKFPFCLPFDAMRILQAFAKEPETPVFSLSVHDPFTGADYAFVVDLSPWDDVAAMVRQLEAIAFFVVFFLNFDKFNVLNIILGNLS